MDADDAAAARPRMSLQPHPSVACFTCYGAATSNQSSDLLFSLVAGCVFARRMIDRWTSEFSSSSAKNLLMQKI